MFSFAQRGFIHKNDDEGNIKMKGKLYNSKNKSETHGTIEALARAHYWKNKATWSLIKIKKFNN